MPCLQKLMLVLFRQSEDAIQFRPVVTPVVFECHGLQPDFRDVLRVNDVDMRWFMHIG
jgi:hypothetical protein